MVHIECARINFFYLICINHLRIDDTVKCNRGNGDDDADDDDDDGGNENGEENMSFYP